MSPADDPAQPGWHAHPEHETVQRYWDGTCWTGEHRFALVARSAPTSETAALPGHDAGLVGALNVLVLYIPR